jgi:hypothetical protein
MSAPELKPCPFCGEVMMLKIYRGERTSYIECQKCQAYGPNDMIGNNFAAWNTRADLDAAQVAELVEGLRVIEKSLERSSNPNNLDRAYVIARALIAKYGDKTDG